MSMEETNASVESERRAGDHDQVAGSSLRDTGEDPPDCPRPTEPAASPPAAWRPLALGADVQAILDGFPSPAMLLGEDQRILAVNKAMRSAKGVDRSLLIGCHCYQIVHCSDEPAASCPLAESRKSGRSASRDAFDEATGRWVQSLVHPTDLRAADGGRVFLHIVEDITDRKEAEIQARASAERFTTLFESAPDACYLIDLSGTLIDNNQAAERLVGYRREEVIGRCLLGLDILAEEDLSRVAADLERAAEGLPTGPEEYTLRRKDGGLVDVEVKTFPVRIQDQHLVLGVARDITERKRAETLKRELEEQLRQSQKIDAIGRLAGGVAHDFNNLLTVIKSCLMFIRESMNSLDPVLEDVEEAEKATERAVALTRQLLAFSRQQVHKPEVADLNLVISNLEKMFLRLVGEDIRIATQLDPGLERAKIDVGHLEQVMVNLAVNARDAMPTGGTLRIQTSNLEVDQAYADRHLGMSPGPKVVISVADTGVGMTPEVVARAFEPFFTTKGVGKGTGLGLSTVYGIVKQADGYLLATSEAGQGTEFKIFLPVYQGQSSEERDPPEVIEALGDRATIMLVEDDPPVRRAACRILAEHGHTVIPAGSGQEAISILEAGQEDFDLVVTDVVMPNMSGKDLADWIENHEEGLPVLYMSGYTDEVIAHHGILEEGVWLLEKPFSKRSMIKMVSEVLAESKRLR